MLASGLIPDLLFGQDGATTPPSRETRTSRRVAKTVLPRTDRLVKFDAVVRRSLEALGLKKIDGLRSTYRETGAIRFAGGYLLKESFLALHEGIREGNWTTAGRRMGDASMNLALPEYWMSAVLFNAADNVIHYRLGLKPSVGRTLLRNTVPVAVGVAALHFLNGGTSSRELAIDAASTLAVCGALDLVIYVAGKPGWLPWAVEIAVGTYFADKLAAKLKGTEFLPEPQARPPVPGVRPSVDSMLVNPPPDPTPDGD